MIPETGPNCKHNVTAAALQISGLAQLFGKQVTQTFKLIAHGNSAGIQMSYAFVDLITGAPLYRLHVSGSFGTVHCVP